MTRYFIGPALCLLMVVSCQKVLFQKQEDDICAHLEDIDFIRYCYDSFDVNHDGVLSSLEANAVKTIDVSDKGIRTLNGIRFFPQLEVLKCSGNNLTALDLSENVRLQELFCDANQLSGLDLRSIPLLRILSCSNNQLASLDVSRQTDLRTLVCSGNRLSALDVRANPLIEVLRCRSNNLRQLDIDSITGLRSLDCGGNPIPSLILDGLTAMSDLNCDETELSTLDLSSNLNLKSVSCIKNPLLTVIWLDRGQRFNEFHYDEDVAILRYKGEYAPPVTIDGNFSDWDRLDAADIAVARSQTGAVYTDLTIAKVYADERFVFVYFEWNKNKIKHSPGVEHVPFHIFINGDGKTSTGGYSDQWSDACMDIFLEGLLYPDGSHLGSFSSVVVYKWTGKTNGSGWNWTEIGSNDSICTGAGVEGRYELKIVRELYPLGELADNFSIGFDIMQGWALAGILPNSQAASGRAPSLKVRTVKSDR